MSRIIVLFKFIGAVKNKLATNFHRPYIIKRLYFIGILQSTRNLDAPILYGYVSASNHRSTYFVRFYILNVTIDTP